MTEDESRRFKQTMILLLGLIVLGGTCGALAIAHGTMPEGFVKNVVEVIVATLAFGGFAFIFWWKWWDKQK